MVQPGEKVAGLPGEKAAGLPGETAALRQGEQAQRRLLRSADLLPGDIVDGKPSKIVTPAAHRAVVPPSQKGRGNGLGGALLTELVAAPALGWGPRRNDSDQ
ncbi:MAG: hypothetical protein ACK46L_14555 [Synechococcaceae cyanobacterium]